MPNKVEEVKHLLELCSAEERKTIFAYLRQEFPIHQIEQNLNVQAEVILEAIHRASDLSLRGVRGLIAESSFEICVVNKLDGWENIPLSGDFPYDFKLTDDTGAVRVQVKMQRQVKQTPMIAKKSWWKSSGLTYVVETQKTRSGIDNNGENTRPYRFDEFDIIAVSMHPSTRDWNRFMYTLASWLIERPNNPNLINTLQPVSAEPDENWTDNFLTCVGWLRAGYEKKIWAPTSLF